MKWTEIQLDQPREISFPDGAFATTEYRDWRSDHDTLRLFYWNETRLELPSAVDVSKQIRVPRVFIVQGDGSDALLVIGGMIGYCLDSLGSIFGSIRLNRDLDYTKYWTTQLVVHDDTLLVIYEGGILAIDPMFNVNWHKRKYFNDFFAGVEGAALVLKREPDIPSDWSGKAEDLLKLAPTLIRIQINNGALLTATRTASLDDIRKP